MTSRNKSTGEDDVVREARRIIERVERDSETIGTSSLARGVEKTKEHFSGADGQDAIERWGKRIGRGLSLVAFIALALWLFNFLGRP